MAANLYSKIFREYCATLALPMGITGAFVGMCMLAEILAKPQNYTGETEKAKVTECAHDFLVTGHSLGVTSSLPFNRVSQPLTP